MFSCEFYEIFKDSNFAVHANGCFYWISKVHMKTPVMKSF